MNKRFIWILFLTVLSPDLYAQSDEHEDGRGVIELSVEERKGAGIEVNTVTKRTLSETLRVPGEVIANAYRSSRVTPRITAQVVARHVRLGDGVKTGQPLVTLSSVVMAEAQGDLVVADREWQRVKSLGRGTVSARRYTEAQVTQQQALARVLAYGMTDVQASALLKTGDASKATGAFDLLAPQDGTVLNDAFIVGELIQPGRVLIDISDESVMWVEAQAVPGLLPNVERGAAVRISVDGTQWIDGTVAQRHHQFSETTRTQGIRIEVENVGDQLHAGQFVEAEIVSASTQSTLAVPSKAVTLLDGVPSVFKIENEDEFHPEEIDTGPTIGDWIVVRGGLEVGDQIAVSGVFHLKSLLLKSSLGEGHAH